MLGQSGAGGATPTNLLGLIGNCPTGCLDPSALTEANITQISADLDWTENGTAVAWEYDYGLAGYGPPPGAGTPTGVHPVNIAGLSLGTTYDWYVRADCGGGSFSGWIMSTFTTATPGNDCSDPIIATFPADLPYSDLNQTNCGRGDNYNTTCLGSYDGGEDIIYRIDVTADVSVDITMDPKGTTYGGILIADDCPDVGTCLDYIGTSSGSAKSLLGVALVAGNSYYIMIDTWPSPNCIPDFDLTIAVAAGPPANDDCSGAIALAVDCACTPITATNLAATDSGETPGCANYQGGDVWFSAVVPANGYLVVECAVNGGFTDGGMAAWTGTCAGLTLYECDDDDGPGFMPMIEIDNIGLAGQTLYFSVWEYGNNSFGDFDICAHTSPLDATWTGTISNDWHDAGNWNTVCYPGVRTNVTIPAGLGTYPTIGASAVCNNILFGSTAAGDASLLDGGFLNILGDLNVERYLTADVYHSYSPSVSGATAGIFKLGSSGPDVYLYSHNEINWQNGEDGYFEIVPVGTPLNVMDGYAVWVDGATWTFEQVGGLNTGLFSKNLTRTPPGDDFTFAGFNYVGNPYPSFIDWDAPSGWNKGNLYNTTWIENAGNWATYTPPGPGVNGGSNIIAPGQGFFVRVGITHTTATLSMDNPVRTNNSTPYLKNTVSNYVKLVATGNDKADEMVIRFDENATILFDSQYDGLKLSAGDITIPQIYSISDLNLAYNALPEVEWVQLGFEVNLNGEYTISLMEIADIPSVWLEDTFTGEFTNLTSDSYTFVASADDDVNRFIVHFAPLSTPENAADLYNIYSYNKDVYVTVPENTKGDIVIFNMMGQEVASTTITDVLNIIPLEKGAYYVVKVLSSESVVTKKVFVK